MIVSELIQQLKSAAENNPEFLNKQVMCHAEDVDAPANVNGFAESKSLIYFTTDCPEPDIGDGNEEFYDDECEDGFC